MSFFMFQNLQKTTVFHPKFRISDEAPHFVRPHLNPNCSQWSSEFSASKQRIKDSARSHLQNFYKHKPQFAPHARG